MASPARKRTVSVSPEWARRNAAARSAGYRSYYDYRVHNYGKIPASQPAPGGETRARLRGHRGASDLRANAQNGDIVSVLGHSERDSKGQYRWVEVMVIDVDGNARTYRLTGAQLQAANLDRLLGALDASGVVMSPSPSLDLRRLAA